MSENPQMVADDVVVSLDYVLTVEGKIVDSSNEGQPLEYLQGHQNIIPGLERALAGMEIGQSREVTVAPAEAYGEYDSSARIALERSQLPPNFHAEVGDRLNVRDDDGRIYNAGVMCFDEKYLHLDLNHPLAGKALTFKATIAGLRQASSDELRSGRIGGGCGGGCSSGDCGSSEGCSSGCCG